MAEEVEHPGVLPEWVEEHPEWVAEEVGHPEWVAEEVEHPEWVAEEVYWVDEVLFRSSQLGSPSFFAWNVYRRQM